MNMGRGMCAKGACGSVVDIVADCLPGKNAFCWELPTESAVVMFLNNEQLRIISAV